MDPVVIVSCNWIKKNIYVFNVDRRGCRVLHLDEKTTHEDFQRLLRRTEQERRVNDKRNFLGDVGPAVRPTSVGITITKQFGVKVISLLWLSYFNDTLSNIKYSG
ncbi:BnaC04g44180D [Brassica napus]|uniref:BnaC04g44180D protein n=1 Tax=Brassica napus TaxID=3708 RepID=A0A078J480_BRANA|nr:BnaC04g44180D [Brassica napus]